MKSSQYLDEAGGCEDGVRAFQDRLVGSMGGLNQVYLRASNTLSDLCTLAIAADTRTDARCSGSGGLGIHTSSGISLIVRALSLMFPFHWLSGGWWLLIGWACYPSSVRARFRLCVRFWFRVLCRLTLVVAASNRSAFSAATALAMHTRVRCCNHSRRFFAVLANCSLRDVELEKHL